MHDHGHDHGHDHDGTPGDAIGVMRRPAGVTALHAERAPPVVEAGA